MGSWVPIMMLVFMGFFIGGVISFVRTKAYGLALAMAVAAGLCGVAALVWWQ